MQNFTDRVCAASTGDGVCTASTDDEGRSVKLERSYGVQESSV